MRGRRVLIGLTAGVVVLAIAGSLWFEPWRLFTHSYADEALPASLRTDVVATAPADPAPATPPAASVSAAVASTAPAPTPPPPVDVVVSTTTFVSGEHDTTGSASLIRLANGDHVVRLADFATSDGPDVYVVLATTDSGSPGVGDYLDLGSLRATSGNLTYAVPAGTDLSGFRSVAIWCKRFDAVFGSAPLSPV